MKQRYSSLDIRAAVNELRPRLIGAYIQNIYSTQQRFLFFKLSTKDILLIEPGVRFHLASAHGTELSHFCKKMRESCRRMQITGIFQYGYDRIVVLEMGKRRVVLEFFSGGNAIILDEEDVIVNLLRPVPDLGIVRGTKYIWNRVDIEADWEKLVDGGFAAVFPFEKEFVKEIEDEALALVSGSKQAGSLAGSYKAEECAENKRSGRESLSRTGNGDIREILVPENRERLELFMKDVCERVERLGGFARVEVRNGRAETFTVFPIQQEVAAEQRARIVQIAIPEKKISEDNAQPPNSEITLENSPPSPPTADNSLLTHLESVALTGRVARAGTLLPVLITDEEVDAQIDQFRQKTSQNSAGSAPVRGKLAGKPFTGTLHFPSLLSAAEFIFRGSTKTQKERGDKTERIRAAQQRHIEELNAQAAAATAAAELIEENRASVASVLAVFKRVYDEKLEWALFDRFYEAEKARGNPISEIITSYDLKNRQAMITLANHTIELDLSLSLNKNIAALYTRSRKASGKATRAAAAMAALAEKAAPAKAVIKTQQRVPYWFERFHFFFASDGRLVIGGRNAQDNELIVKTYAEKGDVYLHCDVHGASSMLYKKGAKPPSEDSGEESKAEAEGAAFLILEEIASMALCYSKAWEDKIIAQVFYTDAQNVSRLAPSGEYLPRGAFRITGPKNYLRPRRLECGVGILFKEEGSAALEFVWAPTGRRILHAMPVAAPWAQVRPCKYGVRLCPGGEKKSQVCQSVLAAFQAKARGVLESGGAAVDEAAARAVLAIGLDEYAKVVPGKAKLAKEI